MESGVNIEPRKLPLEEQQLILRAVFQPGSAGRDAAIAWLPHAEIDNMQFESLRLMPQLYERLRREEIADPLLPRLKGLKKHAWSKNQLLFCRTSQAIAALRQEGIDVMVIKGMALVLGFYRDFSLRPMNDADLLVPTHHARRAIEILSHHGWTSEFEDPANPRRSEWAFQHEHAAHLSDSLRGLDLHWNLLSCRIGPDADQDFWAASVEIGFGKQRFRILNPADQLLHICVHGADLTPIRWIPDALVVLRSTPNLDWPRLLMQARKRNLTRMAGKALQQVQRDFADLVPSQVMTELQRSRVSIFERYECRQLAMPGIRPFESWLKTLCKFLRLSRGMNLYARLRLLPEFLCFLWNVANQRQLPAVFAHKAAKKIHNLFR